MARIDIDNDKKLIDLNPLTTREERKTLSEEELEKLRHTRRSDAREERRERRRERADKIGDVSERLRVGAMRTAQRLGIILDDPAIKLVLTELFGTLAKIPDPDGDGWTPDEIAAEARVFFVDRFDEIARLDEAADFVRSLELAGVEKPIASLLEVSEHLHLDRLLADAILGRIIEDYVEALLLSDDGSMRRAAEHEGVDLTFVL